MFVWCNQKSHINKHGFRLYVRTIQVRNIVMPATSSLRFIHINYNVWLRRLRSQSRDTPYTRCRKPGERDRVGLSPLFPVRRVCMPLYQSSSRVSPYNLRKPPVKVIILINIFYLFFERVASTLRYILIYDYYDCVSKIYERARITALRPDNSRL